MSLPKPVPAKKEKANNMIPEDEILFWIENNVDTKGVEIVKVRDSYLWTKGDIERHRLDLFEKYEIEGEGEFCWTHRIADRAFFLHYDRSNNTITDKTTGRVEKEKVKRGLPKLNGIANGTERIGKSFR
jgi:hypothetical protein